MARPQPVQFKPRNPEKYRGNPTNIIARSSWEVRAMNYFDTHPQIIQWSSEELVIPYRHPVDQRVHRYFPDFVVRTSNGETIVIEIKPHYQTVPPVKGQKKKKTLINETITYAINQRKWEAAEAFCKARGWRFEKLTEHDLPVIKYGS